MKTVVLITTGQPSVNPRVVKEADALHTAGYKVIVLYCFWIRWASEADKKLLKNVSWSHQLVGGSPTKNKALYYFTKARFKLNSAVNKKGHNNLLIAERSQARCYDELLQVAKSIKASLYVGHNLGALSVAAKAAKHNKAASGFDFEDYHREENDAERNALKKRIVYLEEKYLPDCNYISTSSPLITARVKHNFPTFRGPVFSLLNCFPLSHISKKEIEYKTDETLQLFWFSQTVGRNRGLEAVVAALAQLNNPAIHLTLAGRVDEGFARFIDEAAGKIKERIHLPGIIQPNDLPAFAARFDVGLATEKATPLNRNICLTNKIFTYLLAGDCILASDTDAQKEFLYSYKQVGLLYKNEDIKDLAQKIDFLFKDRSFLNNCKESSFALALKELNWENESKKLLRQVSSLF